MSFVGGNLKRGVDPANEELVITGTVGDDKWEEFKAKLRQLLDQYGLEIFPPGPKAKKKKKKTRK